MDISITVSELEALKEKANQGLLSTQAVYEALAAKGLNYSSWASGVANGDTISGLAAIHFLKESASNDILGVNTDGLNASDIYDIRMNMAQRTLEVLKVTEGEVD